MKKSLIVISAAVTLLSVALTSCGKSDTFVDSEGATHVLVTDESGEPVRDEFGNLFEQVTENNKQVTKYYRFPTVVTNKRNTEIENSTIHVDVPKGWETSGFTTIMRICHKGECRDIYQTDCQIEFGVNTRFTFDEVYAEHLNTVKTVGNLSDEVSEIKEEEATILNKKAKLISYRIEKTKCNTFYYCFEQGKAVVEIKATFFDLCFTREEIEQIINSSCTLKTVGTAATQTDSAEDSE